MISGLRSDWSGTPDAPVLVRPVVTHSSSRTLPAGRTTFWIVDPTWIHCKFLLLVFLWPLCTFVHIIANDAVMDLVSSDDVEVHSCDNRRWACCDGDVTSVEKGHSYEAGNSSPYSRPTPSSSVAGAGGSPGRLVRATAAEGKGPIGLPI